MNAGANANGLDIRADHVTVQGLNIRNFGQRGVRILDASNGLIECNLVGTNLLGSGAAPNQWGIVLISFNAPANQNRVVRNVISGNRDTGLWVQNSNENEIQGNYIGTDVSGTAAIGNGGNGIVNSGILILDAINNSVGDNNIADNARGNTIAYNDNAGIRIMTEDAATAGGNQILDNSIYANGGLGIDLGTVGVDANDDGDADVGANQLQNYPVLTSAIAKAASIEIGGTLNSTPDSKFAVIFFAGPSCDGSGFGEGRRSLGWTEVETDGTGNVQFESVLTAMAEPGEFLTATATRLNGGDTSEFSKCIPITPVVPRVGFTSTELTVSEGDGKATVTVSLSVSTTVSVSVNIQTEITTILTNATPGEDFTALPVTTIMIPAGETSATVETAILEDTIDESDEGFIFLLTLPANSNAELSSAPPAVEVTIVDNDESAPVNTPPTAQEVLVTMPGSSIPVILSGSDADGDDLSYTIVTEPQNGTLSGTAPNLTFTPTPGFEGTVNFTYKVNDGLADSTVATVTINVTDNAASTTMKSIYLPFVSKQ